MAPEIAARLAQDKTWSNVAGRVIGAAPDGMLSARTRGDEGIWNFRADLVINGTGPALRTLTADNPLIADLHRQNLIQPGPLGLGTPRRASRACSPSARR